MKLKEFAEKLSWNCFIHKQDGQYCAEIEHSSPLGEDVIDIVWFKKPTIKSFIEGLEQYQSCAEETYMEDAELYICHRPRGTEGLSMRQLLYDADAKVEQFNGFVEETKKLYNRINGIEDKKKTYFVRFHVDTAIDIEVSANSVKEARELAEYELQELDDFSKLEWIDVTYTHTEDAEGNFLD